jgi:putative methionine-R-sulfoxide reductase with GAF domain
MRFAELPRPLRGYLLGLAFGLAPLAYGLTRCPPPNSALLTAMLVLCAALLSTWRLELRIVQGKMTLVFAVVCLALLLQGGVAAVGCAVLGAVIGSLVRPQPGGWRIQRLHLPLYKHWFNAVNGALSCGAGLLPYYTLAALDLPFGLSPVLGLAAFAVLYFTLNTVAVAVAISLQQGLRWTSVWRENFAWTAPGFLASASLAGVIQLLFSYLQAWALLFLAPVYMIYYAYRLHLERVQKDLEHIQELNEFNQAVILSLATAIDAKDRYTCSHINRVREYGLSLARAAGLDGPELQAVATAALVHDVGKLGIPDHILSKPGKLTAEEYRRMQDHVTIGAEILAPVPFKFPVVEVVLTHHERWDGRGYPRGLQGEEIPIGGRIISIVDVFDALTSNRPYRRAMTHEEAMQALRDGAGKQFDPRLVELFFKILPEAGERIARMEAEQAAQGGEEQQVSEATDAFVRIGQAAAEMAAVCDVAQALAEQTTERDVLSLIADRALSLMPADTAIVYLRCPDRGELRAAAIQGKYRDRLEGMAVALGEGVAGTVAETQQPMVNVSAVADIARRFRPDENLELSSATAVPLVQGPEQLGVLAVYTQAYSVLSAHHLNVLNILAEHAAATLQNLRWLELNREMAFTDPLTGLANSR